MEIVTRFAPSPTGNLHLGHAYSALIAEREARLNNGKFLLRIEDIDVERCNSAFEKSILLHIFLLEFSMDETKTASRIFYFRKKKQLNFYSTLCHA